MTLPKPKRRPKPSGPVNIGFAGVSATHEQLQTTFKLFAFLRAKHGDIVLHHLDNGPASLRLHQQARAMGIPRVLHPLADRDRTRADLDDARCDYVFTSQTTLRDVKPVNVAIGDMVAGCKLLLAAPETFNETFLSDIWSVVHCGRVRDKLIYVVEPNGEWFDESTW